MFETRRPPLRHPREPKSTDAPGLGSGRCSYYEVRDDANGAFLGGFYADWYPRENKRGGAWMDALITGDPRPTASVRTWA